MDALELALCHQALLFVPLLHFLELFAELRFFAERLLLQLLLEVFLDLFDVLAEFGLLARQLFLKLLPLLTELLPLLLDLLGPLLELV